MPHTILHIEHLNIGYNYPLIEGITTHLNTGELTLLIGNNGTGKTTLIKSLLKQIPYLAGDILLKNKNIKALTPKDIAQNIAVVFSKHHLPEHYTVLDLISLGKYIHYPYYWKLSKQDKREVEEIIALLKLESLAQKKLSHLSDGNLQKAFIGRALAQNTPIIILDEPTTHLDEGNRLMILTLLRQLAQDYNKTILFSSHDWRLAKDFTDQVWYIKNKKLYSGLAEDIIYQHKELYLPPILDFHTSFIPPKITAPRQEQELLLSLLKKVCNEDLSHLHFIHQKEKWTLLHQGQTLHLQNFKDIKKQLKRPLC